MQISYFENDTRQKSTNQMDITRKSECNYAGGFGLDGHEVSALDSPVLFTVD